MNVTLTSRKMLLVVLCGIAVQVSAQSSEGVNENTIEKAARRAKDFVLGIWQEIKDAREKKEHEKEDACQEDLEKAAKHAAEALKTIEKIEKEFIAREEAKVARITLDMVEKAPVEIEVEVKVNVPSSNSAKPGLIVSYDSFGSVSQKPCFAWLSHEQIKLYGLGAVALITLGGITYVLYKNGTIQKVEQYVKNNTYQATLAAAATAVLSYIIYDYIKNGAQPMVVPQSGYSCIHA